jgi:hypothetical protein
MIDSVENKKKPDLSNDKPGFFTGEELIVSDTTAALQAT